MGINGIKTEHRFTKLEETMVHLEEEVAKNTQETKDGFSSMNGKIDLLTKRLSFMATQQEADALVNKQILKKVDDHVDKKNHSQIVVDGLVSKILGATWVQKLIMTLVVIGAVVLLFPIEEVEKRIYAILTFFGLN